MRQLFSWTARCSRTAAISLRVAAIALTLAISACDDPLSPEDHRRLMGAFVPDDNFWWGELADHQIGGPVTLDMLPTADIVVEVEGEWISYRAFVVERRPVPDTGHFGVLSRSRRYLLAWRLDDPREMFLMGGGQLPGPMGPLAIENEPDEWFAYRPHVFMRLVNDTAMENRSGRAELDAVAPRGECGYPFVASPETIARARRADGRPGLWLPACERWMYTVAFEAELGRRFSTSRRRLRIRMLPQRVPGFRLTGECDGSLEAQSFGCGQLWMKPAPCAPGYRGEERCPGPDDSVPPSPEFRTVRERPGYREWARR